MNKNMKIIILVIVTCITSLLSREIKPEFSLDYNQFFRGSIEKTQIELYLSVPKCNLSYDDSLKGSYSVKIMIYDEDNKLVAKDYWGRKVKLKDKKERWSTAELAEISRVKLKAGVYKLKVELKDLTSGAIETIEIPASSKLFNVEKFDGNYSLSTIQLCSKIIPKGDKESEFYKNGIIILPNPAKIYGTLKPFLNYYLEVYGTERGETYSINWKVEDNDKKIIKTGKEKSKQSSGSSMVLVDRIKVHDLKSGIYKLTLALKNSDNDTIERTTSFKVYRSIDFKKQKKIAVENLDDFIDVLKKDDLEKEFKMIQSVLSGSEKKIAEQLNDDGKRNFVKKYWKEREAEKKGARAFFMTMVSEANRFYSTSSKPGWQTDMGRILMKLGKPDKKDINTYIPGSLDHEIWHYFDGNDIFVFADLHNFGTLKLIHSTYTGEKFDINWRKKVTENSDENGNSDF